MEPGGAVRRQWPVDARTRVRCEPIPRQVARVEDLVVRRDGPITSILQLIDGCEYFGLKRERAKEEAAAMATTLARWRTDRYFKGC